MRIAIIGTGVIGASWAAYFCAHGHDVVATDPAPDAETRLRDSVTACWPALTAMGLAEGAGPARVRFVATAEAAVADAQFVQENGPERLDLKQPLLAALDGAAPPDCVIASSTSTLLVEDMRRECRRAPERIVLGHPFNPPHLIPLVEVLGDDPAAKRAMAFYRAVGKTPIRLNRAVRGHVANRLQAALWQEAIHLVASGVCSTADIDAAIAHGPGLRWGLLGPFLNLHLSGGAGGIAHMLAHLGPPTEAMWRDLGRVTLDETTQAMVRDGVAAELAGRDQAALVAARDEVLVDLLRAKSRKPELP